MKETVTKTWTLHKRKSSFLEDLSLSFKKFIVGTRTDDL